MSSGPKKVSFRHMLLLAMAMVAGLNNSFGCQLQVDENADKNMLIAQAVSNSDLSLIAVSGIGISSFERTFEDNGPRGSCPDYMTVSARVSFTHVKNIIETCNYSVTVSVRTYMGEVWPDGPIEEVNFSGGEATCSISLQRLPKKIVLKKKRIVRFPFPR